MKVSYSAMAQHLESFARNKGGNIAMMWGLMTLPFMAMLALAVDVNNVANHRQAAQSALDSALLAAARHGIEGDATQAEMEAELSNYFSALMTTNGGVQCQTPDMAPNMAGGIVAAGVTCTSETLMSGLMGREQIDYEVDAEVNFGIGKIDVAFVFDVSGSMDDDVSGNTVITVCDNDGENCQNVPASTRMEALKAAAKAGVSQLLTANGDDRDDVRIAMVSYNQAVNAGVYFKAVTGVDPTRTYAYDEDQAVVMDPGNAHNHIFVGLYDTRDNRLIATLHDDSVVEIPAAYAGHLAISAEIKSSSGKYGKDESMVLEATSNGGWMETRTENAAPYALYGDNGGDFHDGFIPTNEWVRLYAQVYDQDNGNGDRISRNKFDFRIDIREEGEAPILTIEDTCTYERGNGGHWDRTTAPGPGKYLTADEVTFDEDSQSWTVPAGCSSATPLALTADQAILDAYINALPTGGGTAGHLGVAWGRYLIAPEWSAVWPVSSKPIDYHEPDARKIIIMMTDGQFNRTYHDEHGTSFEQAMDHCDRSKEQGVIIYTISFDAPEDAQAALDYCSSGVDYAFDVNNGQELLDAYTAIANRISDLRLSN